MTLFSGHGHGGYAQGEYGTGGAQSLLASYPVYDQAQQAVDTLSDRGFPVAGVSIVGADLRLVEQVTGRLTTGRAALAGAGTGAWFGLLIGVVISLGTPYLLGPLLWGLLWGAIFGALIGASGHLAWRGRRDFASTRRLVAARYDVMLPAELLLRAQQLLGLPGGPPPATPPPAGPTAAGPTPAGPTPGGPPEAPPTTAW